AYLFDLHPAEHLPDDGFDVLVRDGYTLQTVDFLDFVDEIHLQLALAKNFQNVVRVARPVDECIAGAQPLAFLNVDVDAAGNAVLFLLSVVRRDVHLTLTLGNLAKANHTIDLRDDRRIARLAGLEQFDNSRQTAGDVLRTGGFARDLREDVAGVQFVSVLHHQVSAAGHQVTLVALGGLDDDGRLTLLVGGVGNHEARKAGDFVDFFVEREAFLQVLELDRTGDFREDRERVRVPLADHIAELDLCTVFDLQLRAVNDRVALLLAALRIDDGDGAVAVHRNQAAVVGTNGDEVDEVNLTRVLGFEVRSVLHARCGSADVEG